MGFSVVGGRLPEACVINMDTVSMAALMSISPPYDCLRGQNMFELGCLSPTIDVCRSGTLVSCQVMGSKLYKHTYTASGQKVTKRPPKQNGKYTSFWQTV